MDAVDLGWRNAMEERAAPAAGFVGIVHGPGGVHFAAVAPNRDVLWAKVATHVRAWASYQLDEATCALVHAALDGGQNETAARLFFGGISRWEPELLFVSPLGADGVASVAMTVDSPLLLPRRLPVSRARRSAQGWRVRRP